MLLPNASELGFISRLVVIMYERVHSSAFFLISRAQKDMFLARKDLRYPCDYLAEKKSYLRYETWKRNYEERTGQNTKSECLGMISKSGLSLGLVINEVDGLNVERIMS